MSTNDSVAGTEAPASFAEIRETLRQVGEQFRENEARAAENEARAKREMAELREELKQQSKAADRRQKEADRRQKEADRRRKEIDRQMKETDRRLKKAEGLFTSQWGKLLESLVEGDLVPLLNDRGIEVETTHQRRKGRMGGEHFEIDIVAVNGREVVVVEVKTTLRSEDVTEFLAKLSVFPDFCKEYRGRRILGAVAYLDTADSVITYAERQGLFVIRATGSSASIVNGPDFEPREFG